MGIENFPAALQPIVQQGLLARAFADELTSKLAYRSIAEKMDVSTGVGNSETFTRPGWLNAVTTPLNPSVNTGLDNGLTPQNWQVEQWTLTISSFAATQDLNMVTSRTGISRLFIQNAQRSGEQARRSLDEVARNQMYNSYRGGNTFVTTALGSPATSVHVDDITGFQFVPGWNQASQPSGGSPSPTLVGVNGTNTMTVQVGSNEYTLVGVAPDTVNSTSWVTAGGTQLGVSGTLTFSTDVTVADGAENSAVVAQYASGVLRPNNRTATPALQSTDTLTMANLLDAKALLERNAVPAIDGLYTCYLDPESMRQIFLDPDFKQLFQVGFDTEEFRRGNIYSPLVGMRFVKTTQALVMPSPAANGVYVHRPLICGAGSLIEGDFEGMAESDMAARDSYIEIVDGVAMVVREALDRLQQIIAQSWYWIGGFTCPSDVTANKTTIPTATSAIYKRAVMIEHGATS